MRIPPDVENEVRETPLKIKSSGTHKLSSDLIVRAKQAVRIHADNVDLDLNGHTVRCLSLYPDTSHESRPRPPIGIDASGHKNVVVRNGTVTSCWCGFQALQARDLRLEGVDFSGNLGVGVNLDGAPGAIVRGCTFAKIAGDTYEAYAVGLNAVGADSVVECNLFFELYRQFQIEGPGEGVGVVVKVGKNVIIRHNWFANAVGRPNTIGIWAGEETDVLVTENTFTNFERGIASRGNLTVTNNRFLLRDSLPNSLAVGANGEGVASWNVVDGYATAFNATTHDNIVHS